MWIKLIFESKTQNSLKPRTVTTSKIINTKPQLLNPQIHLNHHPDPWCHKSRLVATIQIIISMTPTNSKHPMLHFEPSQAGADTHMKVLWNQAFDFTEVMQS
jgi:hypothetical protein